VPDARSYSFLRPSLPRGHRERRSNLTCSSDDMRPSVELNECMGMRHGDDWLKLLWSARSQAADGVLASAALAVARPVEAGRSPRRERPRLGTGTPGRFGEARLPSKTGEDDVTQRRVSVPLAPRWASLSRSCPGG
jgi:hypothetical protein